MNREVELVLSGLHASGQEQESEAVETVQPAQYFKRNDSHYLLYEEKMDEDQAPCRSRIKFRDHLLELTRQGTAEMHMIFEENKRHMIPYNTPYGQLMLGIETGRVPKHSRRYLPRQTCNETYRSRRSVHLPVPVSVYRTGRHHRYR